MDIVGTLITPPPEIRSLNPGAGPTVGSNPVIINGTGFKLLIGSMAVKFGDQGAVGYTVNSPRQIVAYPYGQAAGKVNVQVTAAGGTTIDTPADDYTFETTVVPTVESVTPNSGPTTGGNTVVITGTGFSGLSDKSAVTFGGTDAASYRLDGPTQITAVAPPHYAGTVWLHVNTYSGTSADTINDDYTFVNPPTKYQQTSTSLYYVSLRLVDHVLERFGLRRKLQAGERERQLRGHTLQRHPPRLDRHLGDLPGAGRRVSGWRFKDYRRSPSLERLLPKDGLVHGRRRRGIPLG